MQGSRVETALVKAAVEPLSAALGATLATVMFLGAAFAYARLSAAQRQAHLDRTAKLEAQVAALTLAMRDAKTDFVDHVGRSAGALHEKINALAGDFRELKGKLT